MDMLSFLATGCCWATLGAMVLLGAVVAPTVFTVLDAESAGRFLRKLFPRLYLFCGIMSGIAAICFTVQTAALPGISIGLISVMFFFCRGPLTRWINEARDQELAGVEGAKVRFDRLHKTSVRIFSVQALVLLVTVIYIQVN